MITASYIFTYGGNIMRKTPVPIKAYPYWDTPKQRKRQSEIRIEKNKEKEKENEVGKHR